MASRFCLLIIPLLISRAFAQQQPHYTQYTLNSFLINPAVAGIENYTDLRFGNRMQWTGLTGAPQTKYVSMHTALGKNYLGDNANSFSGTGENPMSRSFVKSYQAAAPHHGVGVIALEDKTGPLKNTEVKLNYAYHLGLSTKVNLAVGVSVGITQLSLDASNLVFEDSSDPFFAANTYKKLSPSISLGMWLYGPRFFGGLALHQLLPSSNVFLTSTTASTAKTQPQALLSAGYKLSLSEDIAAIPSILLNYQMGMPLAVEGNVKLAFKDKFWLGGGYRRNDAFTANAGFTVGYLLNIGYSYDVTTSNLNTVSNGTHEIIVGILLNNRYRVTCPQKNW
jgi:type IX secretion system PorP/SprF family membrane protein